MMYYKNITLVVFTALVFILLVMTAFPGPTTVLLSMLLTGAIIVIQTIVVLKGPQVEEKSFQDEWYENH